MRKINEVVDPETGNRARVYHNTEWGEYIVKFYNSDGIHMDASDYHTSDKQDANDTADTVCRKGTGGDLPDDV